VAGRSVWQGGMEEAPENGKESPHSVHANGLIDDDDNNNNNHNNNNNNKGSKGMGEVVPW